MHPRIRLARLFLRLGEFIQSLPVVVMRPADLIEFSRQTYAQPHDVDVWAAGELVDAGLSPDELDLLAAVPQNTGDLLLLGVGGGREAIPLTRMGFHVTGVDFIPELVKRARENAAQRGVAIDGLVQEISQLDVPAGAYDVVWLSRAMYSCVPTRARRVEMVRRIARALKPGGLFLCQFHRSTRPPPTALERLARRLVAWASLGNREYEAGDMLWGNIEFIHAFPNDEAICSELEAGGLTVVDFPPGHTQIHGNIVCKKPAHSLNNKP